MYRAARAGCVSGMFRAVKWPVVFNLRPSATAKPCRANIWRFVHDLADGVKVPRGLWLGPGHVDLFAGEAAVKLSGFELGFLCCQRRCYAFAQPVE